MTSPIPDAPEPSPRSLLLRRSEQAFIAVALLLGLGALTWYWADRVLRRHDLIEIDHEPALEAKFVVDINHADWPEVMQLPDIGETTARLIVSEREENGPFSSLEEVARRVRGVGPKMIEGMRPHVAAVPTANAARSTNVH